MRVANCLCKDSLSINHPNEFINSAIAFVNAEKVFPAAFLIAFPHFKYPILIGVDLVQPDIFQIFRRNKV